MDEKQKAILALKDKAKLNSNFESRSYRDQNWNFKPETFIKIKTQIPLIGIWVFYIEI